MFIFLFFYSNKDLCIKYIYEMIQFVYHKYMERHPPSLHDEKKEEVDIVEEFIESRKKKFVRFIDKPLCNSNIEYVLYDLEKMKELLKEENNSIEMRWKSNLLYLNTPNGNIVMFYDIYKHGFKYYADSQIISYKILNAVAMTYVERFFCLDFFVDEYLMQPNPSKFLKLWKEEEEKENEKKNEKIKSMIGKELNSNVFLISKEKNERNTSINEVEKRKNKFIYLGKIGNFPFLQKKDAKKRVITKPILYRDYKNKYIDKHQELFQCMDKDDHPQHVQPRDEIILPSVFLDHGR